MKKTTTVPIQADRTFVDAFDFYARSKKTTMSALVRQAIDALYGPDLQRIQEFSADLGGTSIFQSEGDRSNAPAHPTTDSPKRTRR